MSEKRFPVISDVEDLLYLLWSDDGLSYVARWGVMAAIWGAMVILFTFAFNEPRFLVLILFALIYVFISAARFIKDLYNLPELSLPIQYLLASSFLPNNRPFLSINSGKVSVREGEINLIDRIGGPGIVSVGKNNVVMFEKLAGYSRVVSQGVHEIRRYEFIREVISLDVQHYQLAKVEAITVDGIRVRVNQINIQYKLRERENLWTTTMGKELDGTAFHGAMKNFSDNRLVSENGILSMQDTVSGIVAGAIKRYINHHTLDEIITPEGNTDARQALKAVLYGPEVREKLTHVGVRLLTGIQLGAFEFPDTGIDEYRLSRWKEVKKGEIKVLKAEGDAYQFARQDAVRSQTQAEMIRGIITALDDLNLSDVEDLDALIQIRTAQILDMWSGLYKSDVKHPPKLDDLLRDRHEDEENN